jgi:uncharacterized protein (TIGR00290 family)
VNRPKALIAWSSGKDSAWALHEVRREGAYDVIGALTTMTGTFTRVSVHGVREELLDAQLAAAGLPSRKVRIPHPCPNESYEREMAAAVAQARDDGVTHIIFGDLFLEDIRAYREKNLAGTGITPIFPLWGRPTAPLARDMITGGVRAHLVSVNLEKLPRGFAGRAFDLSLHDDLPDTADPCGENGEFHTFVSAGPMFARPLNIKVGEIIERDGAAYADLVQADFMSNDYFVNVIRSWFAKQKGGSLILPDGWYGRPYDNQHALTAVNESSGDLAICLDGRLALRFQGLKSVESTEEALIFSSFERLVFDWVSAGMSSSRGRREYKGGEVKIVSAPGSQST